MHVLHKDTPGTPAAIAGLEIINKWLSFVTVILTNLINRFDKEV